MIVSNNSRKSEYVGNEPKKNKVLGRLQSDHNVPKLGKTASRDASSNFNPVISRQTSYRGDSFGDEASRFLSSNN
jgi:hypothetical protein